MSTLLAVPKVEHTLLGSISKAERTKVVRDLLRSVEHNDPAAGLRLAASIIEQDDSDSLEDELSSLIYQGQVHAAVHFSLRNQQLRGKLLSQTVHEVVNAQTNVRNLFSIGVILSWLRYAKLTSSCSPWTSTHASLLLQCLELSHSKNAYENLAEDPDPSLDVHKSARDVVLELLAARKENISDDPAPLRHDTIWSHIHALAVSGSPLHASSAYAIWLRWSLVAFDECPECIAINDYSELLRQGLRRGDAERRKLCLNILKLTIAADTAVGSSELCKQYDRFAVVFETIVLGRYMNQVVECEKDLDFFASSDTLSPSWLYTLLGAALEGTMQDTNRRFIGNWAMRARLPPSADLLEFFQDDFLPWATQGQHFVATLKIVDGQAVCRHGQHLSVFIARLRNLSPDPKSITDSVVHAILRKQYNMFAYCTVYMLEGLGDSLSDKQKEDLVGLRALPEVARDYVALKIGKPEVDSFSASSMSVRRAREQEVLARLSALSPTAEALEDIWSDVEYLEFPKKILFALPSAMLGDRVVKAALQDDELSDSIAQKIEVLQQVATTKTFLFPPLVAAVRKVLATVPESTRVLGLEQFIMRVAEQPPAPTVDLMLEEVTIPLTPYTFEQYYGERASYGFAAYLDLVSRLKSQQASVKRLLERILHQWRSQKVPPPSVSTWKTVLQLQVLLLCLEQYEPTTTIEATSILESLFYVLAIEPLPHLRYVLEAIIVRMLIRYKFGDILIERLRTKDHHSNAKHLASLMKIGAILAHASSSTEDFAHQLATAFVPLAASSKVVVRHEAQWQMPVLMDRARAQGWKNITDNTALVALDDFIRSMERFHDPPYERKVGSFDPAIDYTMTNLVEGRWFELDNVASPLTTHADFVKLYERNPLPDAPASCIPLGQPIERPPPTTSPTPSKPPPEPQHPETTPTALQTKGTATLTRSLLSSTTTPTRASPRLLIVASLVDNPHNLGGLSRVSEIFGAGQLILQSTNVLSNKDFLSVSVSSHLHIPILALPISDLAGWLREKRREGYTVVGIEQTDRSVVLGSEEASLPEKCVLVAGNEREGVPGTVLVECDILVEIEQKGVTRSLNVQTAVGVVGFEYCRQRQQHKAEGKRNGRAGANVRGGSLEPLPTTAALQEELAQLEPDVED